MESVSIDPKVAWQKHQYEHPNWKARRKEILAKDNHTCLSCQVQADPYDLRVHHRCYITIVENGVSRPKNVWDYEDRDLITVCADCHTQLHQEFNPAPLYTEYVESKL